MPTPLPPLSEAEKAYIVENAPKMTTSEIARKLNRHRSGIAKHARKLGVRPLVKYQYWSKTDTFRLLEFSEKYSYKEIAVKLGRTPDNIDYMLGKLGVKTRSAVFSIRKAEKYTGYHRTQLYRAKKELNQHWVLKEYRKKKNKKPMLRYRIGEDQLEKLCEYLKNET